MNSSYIRGGTQTVAEAMACFQHVIDEAYPNKGYTIAPKRIAIHGSTAIDGENNGRQGLLHHPCGTSGEWHPDDRGALLYSRG